MQCSQQMRKVVESSEATHITEYVKINEAMGNQIIKIGSGYVYRRCQQSIAEYICMAKQAGDPNNHGPKRMGPLADSTLDNPILLSSFTITDTLR